MGNKKLFSHWEKNNYLGKWETNNYLGIGKQIII